MTDTDPRLDADYFAEDAATFGDRMAAARDAISLTQEQLARRLGVKISTVENWEDDRAEPRANKLQMLAGVLNVSIMWLLSGEGDGIEADTDTSEDLRALLAEMHAIRMEQARLLERMARVEKRLRQSFT